MKRAAVIENWAIVRVGVEATLRRAAVTTTVAASTATELLAALGSAQEPIDLVVIGQIADMTPLVAVREVAKVCATRSPATRIIVLTSTRSPGAVMDLCAEGAHAVLSREAADADLAAAIEAVERGHRYVAPDLLDALFTTNRPAPVRPRFDLTVREREVLVELAAGRTNSEISKRLLIGTETVKSHLNNIYDKLDVRRRTHAVSLAVSAGLV